MKNNIIVITIIIEFKKDSMLADGYERVQSKRKKKPIEQDCWRRNSNEYIQRCRFNVDSENMKNDGQGTL